MLAAIVAARTIEELMLTSESVRVGPLMPSREGGFAPTNVLDCPKLSPAGQLDHRKAHP